LNAWIALGGNRADSGQLLRTSLSMLDEAADVQVLRRSRFYRSAPWGMEQQPDFVNAVAELETALSPRQLLELLLEFESRLGRERLGPRWGPRCIDLDLLTYQDLVLKSEDLELPHPRMHLRAFVLLPILELEPGFVIPGAKPAADCLAALDRREVESVALLTDLKQEIDS